MAVMAGNFRNLGILAIALGVLKRLDLNCLDLRTNDLIFKLIFKFKTAGVRITLLTWLPWLWGSDERSYCGHGNFTWWLEQ